MLNIAVVEDEDQAAETLRGFLDRYARENDRQFRVKRFADAKTLIGEFRNDKEARPYDIVFMDILLPYLNGMDASRTLRGIDKTFTLIFVTNMANFAVKGYEVDALDFVVKPVVYEAFALKMTKALETVAARVSGVVIHTAGGLKILPASDVKYIEVSNHYLIYHTRQGDLTARGSLAAAEQELNNANFAKCNVCYLVNVDWVTEVDNETVTVGGDKLKISRAKKKEFMSWLTRKLGRTR